MVSSVTEMKAARCRNKAKRFSRSCGWMAGKAIKRAENKKEVSVSAGCAQSHLFKRVWRRPIGTPFGETRQKEKDLNGTSSIVVYVGVQFYSWFKFYFSLFQTHYLTLLLYSENKGNKI